MKRSTKKIGIFGFGNMGRAIFELIQAKSKKNHYNFCIYTKIINNKIRRYITDSLEELCAESNVIFICIKPQDFKLLKIKKPIKKKDLIIISIMAGVKIDKLKKVFPDSIIIRSMPNLPLQIGKGVTGWYSKDIINKKTRIMIDELFNKFGKAMEVNTEDNLNSITAISGSGPAYVFLFIHSLIQAAKVLGFTDKEAYDIVRQTILGSVEYVEEQKNLNIPELISRITSKGGTTEAALKELNINSYQKKWVQAIKKAYKKSRIISDN